MNKLYKIVLNIPNSKEQVESIISEEMMKKLEPALNEKRIVKIYDDYINTAYIALITPAVEKMKEIESLGTNKLNQIDDSNLRQKRLQ